MAGFLAATGAFGFEPSLDVSLDVSLGAAFGASFFAGSFAGGDWAAGGVSEICADAPVGIRQPSAIAIGRRSFIPASSLFGPGFPE